MSETIQEFYSFSSNNPRGGSVFHVVHFLRIKLLLGEYPKGTKLREIPLAEQFKVSRGTMRTALQKLESEGLVLRLPNGRRISLGIDIRFIQDLYDVRKMLEVKAAEHILKFSDAERKKALENLDSLARRTNRSKSGGRELSVEERVVRDADLHRYIILASGSHFLLQCWRTIEPVMWTILDINATRSDTNKHFEIYKTHDAMVQTLVQGKVQAIDMLKEHIEQSEKLIIDFLSQHTYTEET
ncbi:MAG: GntR family transcriptional regulator [Eubacteriales bacterium]|nr:GntR family transcriptional regulator [Eubacteriales bacterium]